MSNIKGLYFKLNIDKQNDKDIYNFFIQEAKEKDIDKITLLFRMMSLYKEMKFLHKTICSKRSYNADEMMKIFKHGKTHAAAIYGKSVTEDEK
jgi:hypothetical protein